MTPTPFFMAAIILFQNCKPVSRAAAKHPWTLVNLLESWKLLPLHLPATSTLCRLHNAGSEGAEMNSLRSRLAGGKGSRCSGQDCTFRFLLLSLHLLSRLQNNAFCIKITMATFKLLLTVLSPSSLLLLLMRMQLKGYHWAFTNGWGNTAGRVNILTRGWGGWSLQRFPSLAWDMEKGRTETSAWVSDSWSSAQSILLQAGYWEPISYSLGIYILRNSDWQV